jgi:hypothetical protein
MQAQAVSGRRSDWIVAAVGVVWILMYFAARVVLKQFEMETWARVAVALLPMGPFAVFLLLFIRGLRQLDELKRQIQLEALAIAFPLTILLLMTLGLLQRAIDLPFEDWSYAHVWTFLPIFYFLGLWVSARRYL